MFLVPTSGGSIACVVIQKTTGYTKINNAPFMNQESSSSSSISRFRLGIHEAWRGFRDYFGSLVHRRDVRIDNSTSLKQFLDTRASYIAQTSLYGYLRTRAGMLYPQLFDNDEYVQSINAANGTFGSPACRISPSTLVVCSFSNRTVHRRKLENLLTGW